MTLDIWLFAAVCLFILAFCAALKVIPGPTLDDRLLAINIAATLACAGALALTVSAGDLLIPIIVGLIVCILFLTAIWIADKHHGETS
ncbi:MAG: hypothetical protein ABFC78_01530 [Methanoregula sp.]